MQCSPQLKAAQAGTNPSSYTQCDWRAGSHSSVSLKSEEERTLRQMLLAYRSWSRDSYVDDSWAQWIHSSLNNGNADPKGNSRDRSLSLEVVLGWSPLRLTVAVCFPVALSLAIGLWMQSRDPTDLTTIQTAWTVASYVVTASARKLFPNPSDGEFSEASHLADCVLQLWPF